MPGHAVVVKGGTLPRLGLLRESAQDYFRETRLQSGEGIYGVSVCALPDRTAAEVLAAIPRRKRLPHPQIRVSRVEALRVAGFDVVPSGWPGHATLKFPELPTEQDWERLQAAFTDPEPNPVPRESHD